MYILCVMRHNTVFLWKFYQGERIIELSADHTLFFNCIIHSLHWHDTCTCVEMNSMCAYDSCLSRHSLQFIHLFRLWPEFIQILYIKGDDFNNCAFYGRALKASEPKRTVPPVIHLAFISSVGRLRNRKAACTWHLTV